MKNIHIIPTHKPSKLVKRNLGLIRVADNFTKSDLDFILAEFVNIYITSDEDINENDYIITKDGRLVEVSYLLSKDLESASKIILTTDQDLIKDGVRVIDDEFLEWFVKNPSCEWVEINKTAPIRPFGSLYIIIVPNTTQQIIDEDFSGGLEMGQIIPKEEPKQETLEEAYLNKLIDDANKEFTLDRKLAKEVAMKFSKWQQKRIYSEEKEIFKECYFIASTKTSSATICGNCGQGMHLCCVTELFSSLPTSYIPYLKLI